MVLTYITGRMLSVSWFRLEPLNEWRVLDGQVGYQREGSALVVTSRSAPSDVEALTQDVRVHHSNYIQEG
jgi:hypothetical protein